MAIPFLGTLAKIFLPSIGKSVAKNLIPKILDKIPGAAGDIAGEVLEDVWGSAKDKAGLAAERERFKSRLQSKLELQVSNNLRDIAVETQKKGGLTAFIRPVVSLLVVSPVVVYGFSPFITHFFGIPLENFELNVWYYATAGAYITTYATGRTIEKLKSKN